MSKSITFPLLILLVSFSACAQTSHVDEFYQKYQDAKKDKDGVEGGGWQFSFTGSGSSGSKDDWFSKVSFLHCLSIDAARTQELSDLKQAIGKDNFEEWFSVRHGKGRFQMLTCDGKGGVEDVVCIIVGKEGNGLFFHMRGRFSAADKDRIKAAFEKKGGDDGGEQ
jgi:hypothetical protein